MISDLGSLVTRRLYGQEPFLGTRSVVVFALFHSDETGDIMTLLSKKNGVWLVCEFTDLRPSPYSRGRNIRTGVTKNAGVYDMMTEVRGMDTWISTSAKTSILQNHHCLSLLSVA